MHHLAWLIFVFLVEMRFCHIGQAGLKLISSSDAPTSASQSAGIRGVEPLCPCKLSILNGLVKVGHIQDTFEHELEKGEGVRPANYQG